MQIINTYKCNFQCAHCLFNCGPKRRGYLSNYDLEKFMEMGCDDFVNYCGGETFLHPDWKEQLRIIAIHKPSIIRIVTNGYKFLTKNRDTSKTFNDFVDIVYYLNAMNIQVQLCISNDIYHRKQFSMKRSYRLEELISIVKLELGDKFDNESLVFEMDNRDNMTNKFQPLGRAKRFGLYDNDGSCMIDEGFEGEPIIEQTLDPYGRIYACCNAAGYVGTVNTPKEILLERISKIKPQESCLKCEYINKLDRKRLWEDRL